MDKSKYIPSVSGHSVVFGGSGGIGREIVRAMVGAGAKKISFTYGRNRGAAEELATELEKEGVKTFYAPIDVPTSDAGVEPIRKFLDEAVGALSEEVTSMVNTVGISPNNEIHEQTIDDPREGWKKVYEINTIANFFLARTVAERMKEKGVKNGSIVFLSSDNATVSWSPISAHYDSSKAAMELYVKHLAKSYSPIRVVAVAPGWTNTPMNDTLPEDEKQDTLSRIWLGRYAEPSEIATVVAFVAGSGGSFINGTTIVVNGGYV